MPPRLSTQVRLGRPPAGSLRPVRHPAAIWLRELKPSLCHDVGDVPGRGGVADGKLGRDGACWTGRWPPARRSRTRRWVSELGGAAATGSGHHGQRRVFARQGPSRWAEPLTAARPARPALGATAASLVGATAAGPQPGHRGVAEAARLGQVRLDPRAGQRGQVDPPRAARPPPRPAARPARASSRARSARRSASRPRATPMREPVAWTSRRLWSGAAGPARSRRGPWPPGPGTARQRRRSPAGRRSPARWPSASRYQPCASPGWLRNLARSPRPEQGAGGAHCWSIRRITATERGGLLLGLAQLAAAGRDGGPGAERVALVPAVAGRLRDGQGLVRAGRRLVDRARCAGRSRRAGSARPRSSTGRPASRHSFSPSVPSAQAAAGSLDRVSCPRTTMASALDPGRDPGRDPAPGNERSHSPPSPNVPQTIQHGLTAAQIRSPASASPSLQAPVQDLDHVARVDVVAAEDVHPVRPRGLDAGHPERQVVLGGPDRVVAEPDPERRRLVRPGPAAAPRTP